MLAVHGLDRIHNHQVRRRFFGLLQDGGHIRLAENEAVGGVSAQAVGPHLHLLHAFLTGDVQRLEFRPVQGQLQRQRTFADAGFSAHQHQGALHDAPAQQAVYFGRAQRHAVLLRGAHVLERHGLAGSAGYRHGAGLLGRTRHHFLFHHGVPFPARGAPAHPFGIFIAAVGTEPHGLCLCTCHSDTNIQKIPETQAFGILFKGEYP